MAFSPVVSSILIGAAVGAVTSVVTGGNVFKGAVLGGVGGAVGSAVSGAIAGSPASAVGQVASLGASEAGGGFISKAVPGLISDVAPASSGVFAGEAAGMAVPWESGVFAGEAAGMSVPWESVSGGGFGVGDAGLVDAMGGTSAAPAGSLQMAGAETPGFMDWLRDPANKTLIESITQVGGGALKAIGTEASAKSKSERDLENQKKLLDYYKQLRDPSVGGGGVTLQVPRKTTPALRYAGGGGRVYPLINS